MLVLMARIALFLASQAGWILVARGRLRVSPGFAPVAAVSMQVVILFVAGLLNLLVPAGIMLAGAGIASLAWGVVRDRAGAQETLASLPVVWLAVASVVLMLLVRGREVVAYDNFSHWATMVSSMARTGRYPNFMDPMIEFQSYPPGSATWAWYASLVIGGSEAVWLFAQGMAELACVVPILSLPATCEAAASCGRRLSTGLAVAVASLAAIALMTCNASPFGLMVDTLMPLLAGAATVMAMAVADVGDIGDARRRTLALGLVLAFLALVKSAAALFVAAALVVLLLRSGVRRAAVAAALPIGAALLWSAHCSYVFPAADASKHAVSVSGWLETLSGKTADDVSAIASSMAGLAFGPMSLALLLGLVVALVLAAVIDRSGIGDGKPGQAGSGRLPDPVRAALFVSAFYAAYMLGLLGMYVLSMPLGEALALAGADRYCRTAAIFCAYVLLAMLARRMGGPAWWDALLAGISAVAAVVCAASLAGAGPMPQLLDNRRGGEVRDRWEQVLAVGDIPEGSRVVACLPAGEEDPSGYNRWLLRYLMWCPDVRVVRDPSPEELGDLAKAGYDWVVSCDVGNARLSEWMSLRQGHASGPGGSVSRLSGGE